MENETSLLLVFYQATKEERVTRKFFSSLSTKLLLDFVYSKIPKEKVRCMYLHNKNTPQRDGKKKPDYLGYLKEKAAECNPKCVCLVGPQTLKDVLNRAGITVLEGKILNRLNFPEGTLKDDLFVLTVIQSPLMLAKNLMGLGEQVFKIWDKLVYYATKWENQDYSGNIELIDNLEKLKFTVQKLREAEYLAVDIETKTLPIAAHDTGILCISFTWEDNQAAVIPWDHRDIKINPKIHKEIKDTIKNLLNEIGHKLKCIMHNGKFDTSYSRTNSVNLPYPYFDTMLAHYIAVTEEKLTHSLKQLAWHYTNRGGYEECLAEFLSNLKAGFNKVLKKYEKADPEGKEKIRESSEELQMFLDGFYRPDSYENIPFDTLWRYNGLDTITTWELFKVFKPMVENDKKYNFLFYDIFMKASQTFGEIEERGAILSTERIKEAQEVYKEKLKLLKEELYLFPEVQRIQQKYYKAAVDLYESEAGSNMAAYNVYMRQKTGIDNYYNQIIDELMKDRLSLKGFKSPESKELKAQIDLHLKQAKNLKKEALKELPKVKVSNAEPPLEENYIFNFNSPDQLRELLFTEMGLRPLKSTGGIDLRENAAIEKLAGKELEAELEDIVFSTDKESLTFLIEQHDLPNKLLTYRKESKLYSAYIEPALRWFGRDGRVHTSHLLIGTTTSRISSKSPNFLNIPSKDKLIKSFFIPTHPEGFIIQLDMSQMEVRVLAILSQDPFLIAAFNEDKDLHREVAALICNKNPEDVTDDERTNAKKVVFGLIYGRGAKSLADETGMSYPDAKRFIETFFNKMPKVRQWLDRQISFARDNYYVETLFGFRRRLPNISHEFQDLRAAAERQAKNSVIQGTAAMYVEYCTILIHNYIKRKNYKSSIITSVYDSVIIDAYPEEALDLVETSRAILQKNHFKWQTVFMKADVSLGPDWGKQLKYEHILAAMEESEPQT